MRRVYPFLVVALLCLVIGALLAMLFMNRPRGGQSAPVSPPSTPSASCPADADAAREAVVAYMQHLQEGDYAAAHALLSAESRRRHPLDQFSRQAQQGVVLYDLTSARAELKGPRRAEIAVQMAEDPVTATITAVKEQGEWRVVFLGGRPGFPYP